MVHLTRLNNQPFVVNADLIKFIENSPDTVITLLTGEKLVVRESVEDVLERVREFQARFHPVSAAAIAFRAAGGQDAPSSTEPSDGEP